MGLVGWLRRERRRKQRAVTLAPALATNPTHSIPPIFLPPYDVKAAYSFFPPREAMPESLQVAHREAVLEQWQRPSQ